MQVPSVDTATAGHKVPQASDNSNNSDREDHTSDRMQGTPLDSTATPNTPASSPVMSRMQGTPLDSTATLNTPASSPVMSNTIIPSLIVQDSDDSNDLDREPGAVL